MQLAITVKDVVDYLYVDGVPYMGSLGNAAEDWKADIITIPADSHVIAVRGHTTALTMTLTGVSTVYIAVSFRIASLFMSYRLL